MVKMANTINRLNDGANPSDLLMSNTDKMLNNVYLVIFSNYSPWEVDSAWSTYDKAKRRADSLHGDWRVGEMLIDDPSLGQGELQDVRED